MNVVLALIVVAVVVGLQAHRTGRSVPHRLLAAISVLFVLALYSQRAL